MMIAKSIGTVRKYYTVANVSNRGEEDMLRKYMRRISNQDRPVVLSITDTTIVEETGASIQRNHVREVQTMSFRGSNDIYIRARDIYFRARSHRPVRAASIF